MSDVKRCILVVEDQPREREALSRLLRTEGFEVVTASGVAQAAEADKRPIDLVISDLRLSQESGLDPPRKGPSSKQCAPVFAPLD